MRSDARENISQGAFAVRSTRFAFQPLPRMSFPLRAPGHRMRYNERTIASRVDEVLELVEMAELAERMPAALSGGQKQRVALCRALVQDATAYLLDEPISHLDAKLRHKLRGAIRRRLGQSGVPTLWCSPDSLEALSVGDRVAVLIGAITGGVSVRR